MVVLDETQFVKNPRSKGAQAAAHLRAVQRLALTGTPIENHLDELWSIFSFAIPGLLGDRTQFRAPLSHADRKTRRYGAPRALGGATATVFNAAHQGGRRARPA